MAIEKNIVIGADLSGLEKKLDELIAALKDSQKQADKTSAAVNEIADSTENIGESSKKSAKSMGKLGQSVGAIGKNLKGFFVLQFALDTIKELFDNNQQTVDFFATTFNTLQVAFSDFSKFVNDNIGSITGFFKDIFENPLESVKDFGRAIKENVAERIQSALDTLGYLGSAAKKFFSGDFGGALDDAKAAGKEFTDVLTGVDGTFDKVVEGTKNAAAAVSNYVTETVKQGQAMTQTNKQAEIAEVRAQGLIEKYDLQAERLRQVRDDERFTIEERIKANEDLAKVLEEQEQVMLANAQAVVDAKARQLALDEDNIEFQKEFMAATNELAGVQAQVAGFRSEQLMNEMALQRELFDLEVSKKENAQEVAEIEAEAAINAETNIFKQLELEEQLNQQLYDKRLEALELQKGLYVEGTQAYQDMVSEINVLNAERTAQEGEEALKRRELEQATQQARLQMTGNAIGALNDLAQAFLGNNEKNARKAFMVNKALGISQAVVSTAQAVTAALTAGGNPIKLATGAQFVEAGIAAAVGAAQIATISSQQFQAGGGGGGGVNTNIPRPTAPTTAPRTPDFNVVGQSGTNALLQSLQDKPMKAFVVGSEVSTQQQLDRKKVQTSSIG